MEITYIAHSSFKIKSKNTVLVTDPYDPATTGIKFPKIASDIVTVSHDHPDHNMESLITEGVSTRKKVLVGPGEYEVAGISIRGFQTFHDDKKGEERGKNTIYLMEVEEYKVLHLGDLGHKIEQSMIEKLGTVDILMVPVGGVYTIGSADAVEMVHAIEPKIVIPMHYHLSSLKEETFGGLEKVEEFLNALSLPVEETDKLVLKGPLAEEQKVVKLKPLNG